MDRKSAAILWQIVNNVIGILLIVWIVKKVKAAKARKREQAQWAD